MATRTRRIGRTASPLRIQATPIVTVLLGSLITAFPIITTSPILPPMGLLILLAWRLLHPGLWPVWIGFPLGAFDDIFSGQPFGSAIFFWSLILIAIELADRRAQQRDYITNWWLAALAIAVALAGGLIVADPEHSLLRLPLIAPQFLLSVLLYPFVARMIAALDRWRHAA